MEAGFVSKDRLQLGVDEWKLATWLCLAFMHVLNLDVDSWIYFFLKASMWELFKIALEKIVDD
jgi:hypothetical protein